jgi:hypothetical protein
VIYLHRTWDPLVASMSAYKYVRLPSNEYVLTPLHALHRLLGVRHPRKRSALDGPHAPTPGH